MIREFTEYGMAVCLDSDGTVLRQLAIKTNKYTLSFPTKKIAAEFAVKMGIQVYKVEKHKKRFETVWVVRWDYRFPYYIACWEV